ncbi:endonuclease domain-containing protein [Devosia sediminis]|uniref:Endonuclease domain-containing protein n=1 Tax=Devosia sediminis TaxID=2798801 RepID=A0A934MLY8_9HYPH|nr:endonuclease domain-containing protein [Devosia sediminis]MBJ3786753.1 endonuclease domain-containing protein [Devosia sediminis]
MSQLARKLRRNPTPAEIRFWKIIESLRRQYHFRKQVPMGPYVVDFVSHKARVVGEIDGETHFVGTGPLRDQVRDAALAAQGYRVLRFTNEQVMRHADGVFQVLIEALTDNQPPP